MRFITAFFIVYAWINTAFAESSSIIVIQGSSSCGKTTTAHVLQQMLADKDKPFMLIGIDQIMASLPTAWVNLDAVRPGEIRAEGLRFVRTNDKKGPKILAEIGPVVARARSAAWASVAAFAKGGNHVLLEGAFLPTEIEEGAKQLKEFKPLFVGIRCSIQSAEDREKKRGGFPGLARGTAEMLGEPKEELFAITVDTTTKSPKQAASLIYDMVMKRK